MKNILSRLPAPLADKILKTGLLNDVTEVSLRADKDTVLRTNNKYFSVGYSLSGSDLVLLLQKFCDLSVYAYMDEIKNGFVTVTGGHRVGVCGTVVTEMGRVTNIKNISSLNIRVAHEVVGCSDNIPLGFGSLLVISPPGCGKTTILRDLCRRIGQTHKVSIVDERGELAAMHNGKSNFNLGAMTDVMSLCPKRYGIEYVLRSMSPDYIVTDEIAEEDKESVKKALSYGVGIIASAHGNNIRSTLLRLGFERGANIFDKILLLSQSNGVGTIEKIININEK